MVEFCRSRAVAKLVYVASSTKFAIEGDGRHQNPYSFTKATNVDLINDYGRWYGLTMRSATSTTLRPARAAAGKYATLIAKFEQKLPRRIAAPRRSPGHQRRAFTLSKTSPAVSSWSDRRDIGDGYALGVETSRSVLEIAEAFGGPIELVEGYPGRDESDNDLSKARDELGWAPTVDVMDYIRSFVLEHPRSAALA